MADRWIRKSGAWRKVKSNWIWKSGAWRKVKNRWIWKSGAWRKIYSSTMTSVSVNTQNIYGQCMYYNPQTYCTATTGSVTATPEGGSGHTYQWEKVSGTTFTITSPNSATTTFKRTSSASASGVYRCKVTDSSGVVKYSPNVTVQTDHGQLQ